MALPLDDAKAKIERAKQQISDLEGAIIAFKKTDPYALIRENDPQTGEQLFKVLIKHEIPVNITLLIGEAIQSLRSALDYTVCELVIANGGKISVQTGFPIYRKASPDEYKAFRTPKVKGARHDAIDYIDGLNPYQGGNEPLWRLSELNNREKHRLLLTAALGYKQGLADVGPTLPPEIVKAFGTVILTLAPTDAVFPLKDGAIFFRLRDFSQPPHQAKMNFQFTFAIAFDEPQIIQGEPVVPFLHQSTGLVSSIVANLGSFIQNSL